MGLYTRNNYLSERSSSIDHSRGSVDYSSEDFTRNVHVGNGLHVDLGRDSVIDPTDIQAILRKKQKETRILYR